jgi:MFS transporter, DHA1 family, multidrug resistance protein
MPADGPGPERLAAAEAGESLAADFEARAAVPTRRWRRRAGQPPPAPPADGGGPARVTIVAILSDARVRVIVLVVFVIMLGFGIVAPILPLFARSFGVGYGLAGLLISAFAIMRLITDLVAGPIVDRFGERRAASAGIGLVAVSSVLTGLAPVFGLAVAFRAAGGAGSAVLFATLYSYLLKVVPKANMAHTLGLFYGAFNVGIVAGGPVGGVLAHLFGLASPLFVYAGVLAVSGLLFLRFVPDVRRERPGEEPAPGVERSLRAVIAAGVASARGLLADRTFATVVFANFAYLWMVAGVFDTLVPLFGRYGLGMSTVAIGGVFAVALAAEFVVLYPAGSAADRVGRKAVELPSMIALAVAVAAVGWAGSLATYAVLMAVLGLASGYAGVPPAAMLADVAPDESRATAVGVFRFAGDLGFVLGPLVAGVAAGGIGFRGAFAIVSLPMAVCALLLIRMPETLARPPAAAVSRPPGSSPDATPSTPGSPPPTT